MEANWHRWFDAATDDRGKLGCHDRQASEWVEILDSDYYSVYETSIINWRKRFVNEYSRKAEIRIIAAEKGHCDIDFGFAARKSVNNGGNQEYNAVSDLVTQRITSIDPPLLPDYNRDGKIDADDVARWMSGNPYRYWINESDIKGDIWAEKSVAEGLIDWVFGTRNAEDSVVNGTYDLINFFALAMKFQTFKQHWSSDIEITVRECVGGDNFNYTFTDTEWNSAGDIYSADVVVIVGAKTNLLSGAAVATLGRYAGAIPNSRYSANSGLMVLEAKNRYVNDLKVEVMKNGSLIYDFRLPVSMSPVDEMYRFVNMRAAVDSVMSDFSGTDAPPNCPDSEFDPIKDVFFVHGFNVSPDAARNWNREIFKRMWVSGLNARYWGVNWYGDYHLLFEYFNGLHYHRDVKHALVTAESFKNLVNTHGTNSVVIGHSLGNMVVGEALRNGTNAHTYFMLDAAVASECYNGNLQATGSGNESFTKYVPNSWRDYNYLTWAANWHRWFDASTDDRGKLGWRDHFAPLLTNTNLTVYNYYSTGDEVFIESEEVPDEFTDVFHWPTIQWGWPPVSLNLELDAHPWQKQEVLKGVSVAGSLSGGWGFRVWATVDEYGETTWHKYSAAEANAMVASGAIANNPVFDRGFSPMLQSTISEENIAEALAYHVPAVSSAVGRTPVLEGTRVNFNLNSEDYKQRNWPRRNNQDERMRGWLHSDIKNVSFRYTFNFFRDVLIQGDLK